ncbi:DUF86 domain-containing protein [Candidatus Woesearchaeota archaeon]|nr:DUF86 domain-containing protein [Candidatus Woesearchaeota archaeon]
MTKDNLVFLKHIIDSISDIENSIKYISRVYFENDHDIKDANVRRLEIIGEAVKNLSSEFKKQYSNINWAKIAGLRDIVTHAYFKIDLDIIWEIITRDIPILKKQIKEILKKEKQ